ncbi:MAG TPA: DegT/DnrJ/EryC1/StrS aminotransferase family protein [Thermoleophilaceae bacterium]
MHVPYFRPPAELRAGLDAMNAAYLAGHATQGPEVAAFEEALAERLGVHPEQVVSTSSCTDALLVTLMVLAPKRAVAPALTWNATANVPEVLGIETALADVDERACLDPAALPAAGPDTAVLPVGLYGNAFDERVFDSAATVIVDAAQTLEHGHHPAAEATCFSFHAVKSLPLGHGGAAVFGDRAAAGEARRVAQHGFSFGPGPRTQVVRRGLRAFMTAPTAAMGTALLPHVDGWAERRREIGEAYAAGLAGLPQVPRAARDAWHMFVLLPRDRDGFRAHCSAAGVDTAAYYTALPEQPAWSGDGWECPRAVAIGRRATSLPLHPTLTGAEVRQVVDVALSWPGWRSELAAPPARPPAAA